MHSYGVDESELETNDDFSTDFIIHLIFATDSEYFTLLVIRVLVSLERPQNLDLSRPTERE